MQPVGAERCAVLSATAATDEIGMTAPGGSCGLGAATPDSESVSSFSLSDSSPSKSAKGDATATAALMCESEETLLVSRIITPAGFLLTPDSLPESLPMSESLQHLSSRRKTACELLPVRGFSTRADWVLLKEDSFASHSSPGRARIVERTQRLAWTAREGLGQRLQANALLN